MNKVRSADGTMIALDVSGQGPSLILVVGAFSDRSSTKALASSLGSQFTVYEYDRRGRGESGDTDVYSVESEVEDLAAVAEAAGGSAFVFGHSSGAALALEAAVRGVPVRKLGVYEPPYTKGPTDELAEHLAMLAAVGRRTEATERFLALQGIPADVINQMKTAPYWNHMQSFAHTLPYEIRLCNGGSVPADRLAKITVPTLALAGGASPAWARDGAVAIARAVPDGRHLILEGQTHGVADDVLVPVLTEFFV